MLGTTINREGIKEDIDNRDYTYSPDRPVPSFDARLGRQQPTYDRYASAEVVNQRPVARQDMYAPVQDPAREDLWNRLNTNNVSRGAVENRYSARPEVEVFEPMRLRETQTRVQAKRKASKQLSTQGKVIMAVYLAVVLLIVTLVIINAELINTPSTEPVQDPAAAVSSVYDTNESGLNFVHSSYNTFETQTNWFDATLDKLGE